MKLIRNAIHRLNSVEMIVTHRYRDDEDAEYGFDDYLSDRCDVFALFDIMFNHYPSDEGVINTTKEYYIARVNRRQLDDIRTRLSHLKTWSIRIF